MHDLTGIELSEVSELSPQSVIFVQRIMRKEIGVDVPTSSLNITSSTLMVPELATSLSVCNHSNQTADAASSVRVLVTPNLVAQRNKFVCVAVAWDMMAVHRLKLKSVSV